jgi:hypothetical protein
MLDGTAPVSGRSTPVDASIGSSTSSRMWCTSCWVSSDCGDVVGTTCHITSGESGLEIDCTLATPGVASRAWVTWSVIAALSSGRPTTRKGPLNPGPKPSANRS